MFGGLGCGCVMSCCEMIVSCCDVIFFCGCDVIFLCGCDFGCDFCGFCNNKLLIEINLLKIWLLFKFNICNSGCNSGCSIMFVCGCDMMFLCGCDFCNICDFCGWFKLCFGFLDKIFVSCGCGCGSFCEVFCGVDVCGCFSWGGESYEVLVFVLEVDFVLLFFMLIVDFLVFVVFGSVYWVSNC